MHQGFIVLPLVSAHGGTITQHVSQAVPWCPATPALVLPVSFTSCSREGQGFTAALAVKVCVAAPVLSLLSGYSVLSGCFLSGGPAAGSACACPQGKLETIFVDAVAVIVLYYKPISVISLLLSDEIKPRKPNHRAEQD